MYTSKAMQKLGIHKKITLTFLEEVLGSSPSSKDIYKEFIADDLPENQVAEEIAALPAEEYVEQMLEKGTTVFPRTAEGIPFIYDYQIKGYFKDACGMLVRIPGSVSNKNKTAFKKKIDGVVNVYPRQIQYIFEGEIGDCQRPLRAETAQGPRVALANSETVPAGATITFYVQLLDKGMEDMLVEWLEYGCIRGSSQWRNSGKGRFTYEIEDVTEAAQNGTLEI